MTTSLSDADVVMAFLASRDAACPECGYNLRGLAGDRCPECRSLIELTVAGTQPTKRPHKLLSRSVLGLLVFFMGWAAVGDLWWVTISGMRAPTGILLTGVLEALVCAASLVLLAAPLIKMWGRKKWDAAAVQSLGALAGLWIGLILLIGRLVLAFALR